MPIVLNTKTYNWSGWTPQGLSGYLETSGGTATSFSPLTAGVTVSDSGASNRISWKLKVPYVATASDECACEGQIIDEDIVDIVIRPSRRRTAAGRTDLWTRIKDLTATAQFRASVESLTLPSS